MTDRWNSRLAPLFLLALLGSLMPAAAFAVPVQWTFSNVRFADGGTASGSFVYDAETQELSVWSVSVAGGGVADFPPLTYDRDNATFTRDTGAGNPQPTLVLQTGASPPRQLRFTPNAPLSNVGGEVPLDLNTANNRAGGVECYNCTPSRLITDGILFGAPVGATFQIRPGITGNWNNRAQDGHGFQFEVLPGGVMTAIWFAFDNDGNQAWISGAGTIEGDHVTMSAGRVLAGRFPPNFNPAEIQRRNWGTLVFTFTDCDNGRVDWTSLDTGFTSTGTLALQRLTRIDGLACP